MSGKGLQAVLVRVWFWPLLQGWQGYKRQAANARSGKPAGVRVSGKARVASEELKHYGDHIQFFARFNKPDSRKHRNT